MFILLGGNFIYQNNITVLRTITMVWMRSIYKYCIELWYTWFCCKTFANALSNWKRAF